MGLPTHGLNWDCQAEKILKSFLVRVCCSANRFLHPVSNRYACPAEIGFTNIFLAAKNIIGRSLATTIEKMSAVTGLLAVLSSNKIVSFYNHAGSKPAA